jgi:Putative Actinobacterial Holin-X, holin superfamily III
MVAEAQVISKSSDTLAPVEVARRSGEVFVDALTLAELQFQLVELDLHDAQRRLTSGLSLLSIGALVGASTLPALIGAVSLGLAQIAKIELWIALLINVGVALFISICAMIVGTRKLKLQGGVFTRSRKEWRQNVKWLKAMLSHPEKHHRYSNEVNGTAK